MYIHTHIIKTATGSPDYNTCRIYITNSLPRLNMPRTTTFAINAARAFGLNTESIEPYIPAGMIATGGTITTSGNYKIHTFTTSGTFTIVTLGSIGTVNYVVIGSGGGGGVGGATGQSGAGGGGAGAYKAANGFSVSVTGYSITIGAGGASSSNGASSVFSIFYLNRWWWRR